MRKRKVMIMSLKDSMIRGLALSGMDAIAQMCIRDSPGDATHVDSVRLIPAGTLMSAGLHP